MESLFFFTETAAKGFCCYKEINRFFFYTSVPYCIFHFPKGPESIYITEFNLYVVNQEIFTKIYLNVLLIERNYGGFSINSSSVTLAQDHKYEQLSEPRLAKGKLWIQSNFIPMKLTNNGLLVYSIKYYFTCDTAEIIFQLGSLYLSFLF